MMCVYVFLPPKFMLSPNPNDTLRKIYEVKSFHLIGLYVYTLTHGFPGGAGDTVQQGSGKDIIDSLELTS